MRESNLQRDVQAVFTARGGYPIKYHGGPYSAAGVPDIIGPYRSVFVYIETKLPGQEPTPIQVLVHKRLDAAGAIGAVVHSAAEAALLLDRVDDMLSKLLLTLV